LPLQFLSAPGQAQPTPPSGLTPGPHSIPPVQALAVPHLQLPPWPVQVSPVGVQSALSQQVVLVMHFPLQSFCPVEQLQLATKPPSTGVSEQALPVGQAVPKEPQTQLPGGTQVSEVSLQAEALPQRQLPLTQALALAPQGVVPFAPQTQIPPAAPGAQ
jgi:hypothetical protein